MELQQVRPEVGLPKHIGDVIPDVIEEVQVMASSSAFIEANTIPSTLQEIKHNHIIPVFVRENEAMISHSEFIEAALEAVNSAYASETVLKPSIRLSHPVKGRVPEAKHKPKNELLEHETTLYYERMAFVIEIPSIHSDIDGNRLNLTVGGVKAYNLDNVLSKSKEQQFKVFVGFENKVCTNLCVNTDGYAASLKVRTLDALLKGILGLLQEFNPVLLSNELSSFSKYQLTERQFAHLIGKCKMYKYASDHVKEQVMPCYFGDGQINAVCKDYYSDQSFCSDQEGNINLWKLYNLLTGVNKSSYIDSFLDRSVNAFDLVHSVKWCLDNKKTSWYLNAEL